MTPAHEIEPTWEVTTPSGVARIHLHAVAHGRPRATLVLGHGAGKGVDAPDLVAVASALPDEGIEVVLVEQPWRVRGLKVASAAATLDAAWTACVRDLRGRGIGTRRLVAGGRSSGARVACRTASELAPAALFLMAFPANPIRRPSLTAEPVSRIPELVDAARLAPTVVVQGVRDRMGSPGEIALALAEEQVAARVVPIPGADHSFRVAARANLDQAEALELIVRAARATALRIVDGRY